MREHSLGVVEHLMKKEGSFISQLEIRRPKIYGVNRPGINDGANTIFCLDLESEKVLWNLKKLFMIYGIWM